MKKTKFLFHAILLITFFVHTAHFATKLTLYNMTPYAVTLSIKGVGLVFASDLPRVALLSSGEKFEFDAGFGGIEEITTCMCGVVSQFVLDIKGEVPKQDITLRIASSDLLILVMDTPNKPVKQELIKIGSIIKQTRAFCPCFSTEN